MHDHLWLTHAISVNGRGVQIQIGAEQTKKLRARALIKSESYKKSPPIQPPEFNISFSLLYRQDA
jgi:hypothetical protein